MLPVPITGMTNMPEWEVQCFRNSKLQNGEWKPIQPIEIPLDNNGIGITLYQNLHGFGVDQPEILYNEATDDVLTRTRKDVEAGKYEHYFSRISGVLVTVFSKSIIEGVE